MVDGRPDAVEACRRRRGRGDRRRRDRRTTSARSTTSSRYVLALIALITFVLLVRTFRSVLLPLKAVLLNLVSLAAVFGSSCSSGSRVTARTQSSTSRHRRDHFWLPVRDLRVPVRPVDGLRGVHPGPDARGVRPRPATRQAVITGIGRTGRLVTSAALILFFAFAALASAPGTDIKVLGTALGVGILIDATIVRALLVPALVSLFGRWNWWLPAWVAKVLRVEPSPLAPRQPVD